MALPDSYTMKVGAIPAYLDAILDAEPPERFSVKFLENLGFTSTNDRLFIGILKDLGFLNRDGMPTQRYYEFLDRPNAKRVLAQAIRDAFSDLFAVNKKANGASSEEIRNKLRTLYAGKKTNLVISHIAKTFKALTEYADFSSPTPAPGEATQEVQANETAIGETEKELPAPKETPDKDRAGGPLLKNGYVTVPHQYCPARHPRSSGL